MGKLLVIAVLVAPLCGGVAVRAQQQSQTPPADTTQSQKKPACKSDTSAASSSKTDCASSSTSSSQKDNPFPEETSRNAAEAAGNTPPSPDAKPPAKSRSAEDNPFPEDVSQDAAKAATKSSTGATAPGPPPEHSPEPLPPGVSSSRSGEADGDPAESPGAPANALDPARAKKDAEVGHFYLQSGDYRGAYLRYKEAMAADPANMDAVFGAAEAARELKQLAEAERDYQFYLAVLPDGPKAKQAEKELRSLPAPK